MLKNLGVKARRSMRAFLGATAAATLCAVVSPALAGSVTQPGETIGLAAGAPLPEGVYFVNTLNWGVRQGENGKADVTLGVNIPVVAWATPAKIAGARFQLLGALPALEVGVQDADHDSGLGASARSLLRHGTSTSRPLLIRSRANSRLGGWLGTGSIN
jgi:hypothetical protein